MNTSAAAGGCRKFVEVWKGLASPFPSCPTADIPIHVLPTSSLLGEVSRYDHQQQESNGGQQQLLLLLTPKQRFGKYESSIRGSDACHWQV